MAAECVISFQRSARSTPTCSVLAVVLPVLMLVGASPATAQAPAPPPIVATFFLTHTSFQVGPDPTPLTDTGSEGAPMTARVHPVPRGSAFKYRLSAAAMVTIRIHRRVVGRRVGARCLTATRARRHLPRCTRLLPRGVLHRHAKAGTSTEPFSGRIGRTRLRPGRYRAAITPVVASEQRVPAARLARFTILPG